MSQLNNSKSKQQYSFSKSSRFQSKQSTTPLCYDVHIDKENKGAVIGNGKRPDWTKTSVVSPAPKYKIKDSFTANMEKKKGPSIGVGRQNITGSNQSYITINLNPGPASYNTNKLNHSTSGCTIAKKTPLPCPVAFLNDKTVPDTPGPGQYRGASSSLLLRSSSCQNKLITSTSERFKERKDMTPGPGYYNTLQESSVCNRSLDRSIGSICGAKSFSRSKRTSFVDQVTKKATEAPGPGKYKIYSEFDVKRATVHLSQL